MDDQELVRARWATLAALTLVLGFYLYTQAPWTWWISILVAAATAVLLTAVLEFWLRLSLRRTSTLQSHTQVDEPSDNARIQLNSVLTLQRKFLEAHSEKDLLEALLENGVTVLRANGASFVPFDEWGQSLPALMQGQVPAAALQNWAQRLKAPETRQACKNCQQRHGTVGCVLVPAELPHSTHVNCFALQSGGRALGIVNFYFDYQVELDPATDRKSVV